MGRVRMLIRRQCDILKLERDFAELAELGRTECCCADRSADLFPALDDLLFRSCLNGGDRGVVGKRG